MNYTNQELYDTWKYYVDIEAKDEDYIVYTLDNQPLFGFYSGKPTCLVFELYRKDKNAKSNH